LQCKGKYILHFLSGIGKYTGKICADKATIEAVIQQEHEKLRLHQAKLDNLQAKYKVMM